MSIFNTGVFDNRARVSISARRLMDTYGRETLIGAKEYYTSQGIKRPIMLNETMIKQYLNIKNQYKQ